jgi:hypothetical protein
MKLRKYSLVILSILMLMGACFTAAATSVTDPTNDVWHWSNTGTAWSWVGNVANKPNIDITEISSMVDDNKITLSLKVVGTIQSSDKVVYWVWYNTTDASYWMSYMDGNGSGFGMKKTGMNFTTSENFTISGNTLSVVLDVLGEVSQGDLWGYAVEYTTTASDLTSEWWGDWAPNDKFPYETSISDNTSGTNTTGDTSGSDGSTSDNNQSGSGSGSTPGFEAILVLGAVATALIILRKRR